MGDTKLSRCCFLILLPVRSNFHNKIYIDSLIKFSCSFLFKTSPIHNIVNIFLVLIVIDIIFWPSEINYIACIPAD